MYLGPYNKTKLRYKTNSVFYHSECSGNIFSQTWLYVQTNSTNICNSLFRGRQHFVYLSYRLWRLLQSVFHFDPSTPLCPMMLLEVVYLTKNEIVLY